MKFMTACLLQVNVHHTAAVQSCEGILANLEIRLPPPPPQKEEISVSIGDLLQQLSAERAYWS